MPSETKTSKRAAKSATNGETNKPVLVTTEFRGVFYGRLEHYDADKQTAILTDARCAIQWRTTGGFLELAERGPNSNSKIGSKAPRIHLNKVTSIAECTPAAITAWENA